MHAVWFYTAVLGFGFGIFWQSFYELHWLVGLWFVVVAGGLYLVARKGSQASFAGYAVIIFLTFSALGLWRLHLASLSEINIEFENRVGEEVSLVGQIVREPEVKERQVHLYVLVDDELILITTDRYQEFNYGEQIKFSGHLSKPESFTTDLGRTFNYPRYLQARGVSYMISFAKVETMTTGEGNILLSYLYEGKQIFLNHLETLLVEPQVGLAEGLLLGVKRAIGEDLETIFRETGIIHIVVLSGYNIMIVVTFVMFILGSLLNKKWQVGFGVVAIVLFAILVGLSATVVRASIMASLLLIMGLTGRSYLALRGLFLAGFIMLLLNPYLLAFDTGFQLSFMATLGLILLSPLLQERLQKFPNFVGSREFLIATLATQIFVLPLLLFSIGEFSLVAVMVNVLVLPMVPVAMLLTFVSGMVGFISTTLALPLAFITHLSLTYIIKVATAFSALPFASFAVPEFSFWWVPVFYVTILYLIYYLQNKSAVDSVLMKDTLLEGWTIEEEISVSEIIPPLTKNDTPIFFR